MNARSDTCARSRIGTPHRGRFVLGARVIVIDARVEFCRYGREPALRGTLPVNVKCSRSPVISSAQLAVWE